MKVSPGRAVIPTTISSDSTRVPPVTAERSPPDSRITGADSPVIADSSTLAIPSITSPSLGMTSPAATTTSSSMSSAVLGQSSVVPSARRRWATVSDRVLRRVSACALPRPSAIASAKLANSTVNQRNSVTRPVNTFSSVVDELRSLKNRIVVSTEPTPTTNMTGLRMSVRGLSLTKLSPIARRTISGSTSLLSLAISALRSEAELLDDGAEREDGEEGQGGDDEDHAEHRGDEQRSVGRERSDRGGDAPLAHERAGQRQRGDDEEEASEQHHHRERAVHRQRGNDEEEASEKHPHGERAVHEAGVGGEAGERRAVVVARRGEGVDELREPVRSGVGDRHVRDGAHERRDGDADEHDRRHHEDVDRDQLHLGGLDLLAEV